MKKKPTAENEKGLSRRYERWKVAVVAVWSVVGAMLLALGTSSPAFASPIPGPGPQVAIIPGAAHSPHREAAHVALTTIADFANRILLTHGEGILQAA